MNPGQVPRKLPSFATFSCPLQKDLIILYDVHTVFAVDALASSHPLSCGEEEVHEPAEISQMFSAISYKKVFGLLGWAQGSGPELLSFLGAAVVTCCSSGSSLRCLLLGFQGAAVLRMLSDFLTDSVFTRGVSVSNLLQPCVRNGKLWCPLMLFSAPFCFQSYLNTFAFKNAGVRNLWDHLQQVSGCRCPRHT